MDKLEKPLDARREELSDEQFQICRLGATERPFTGKYNDTRRRASTIASAVMRRCSMPMPSSTPAVAGPAISSR